MKKFLFGFLLLTTMLWADVDGPWIITKEDPDPITDKFLTFYYTRMDNAILAFGTETGVIDSCSLFIEEEREHTLSTGYGLVDIRFDKKPAKSFRVKYIKRGFIIMHESATIKWIITEMKVSKIMLIRTIDTNGDTRLSMIDNLEPLKPVLKKFKYK
jgi:hypothetical protein